MKFLKTLFGSNNDGHLKLQFSKADNTWHVLDGLNVVYVGEKDKCLRYMDHRKLMNL